MLEEGVSEDDVDRWVQTASVLHSNGDGYEFGVQDGRIVGVRGRADDRINHGRLDVKDLYGWQANASPDRLTRPLVRDGGRLVESDWDTAMGRIVGRSRELLDTPGGWGRIGFYTSGQLFLEEYYTLGVIGKAGIGSPHMDGNTRLCTATAAAALKASFGTDGQPGSYTDVDHCDALAIWGHNVAETQTVLWMRMLDRRAGSRIAGLRDHPGGHAGGFGHPLRRLDGAPGGRVRVEPRVLGGAGLGATRMAGGALRRRGRSSSGERQRRLAFVPAGAQARASARYRRGRRSETSIARDRGDST